MNKVIFGDCRDSMRKLIADGVKVQTCITSPPYWALRDYGHAGQLGLEALHDCLGWATGELCGECHVCHMVEVFRLARDVLADDGTLWLNYGDSYASAGGACWQGKNGQRADRRFTASRDTVAMRDIGRRPPGALKPKDLCGIPWRIAFALQADGWYLRQDIIWHKPNLMPESVTDRCTKAHEYLFLLSKSERYYFDAKAIQEESVTGDPRRPYGSKGAWDMDGRPEEQKHGGEPRSWKGSEFQTGKTAEHQLGRSQKVRSPAGWKTGPGSHGSIHDQGREQEVSYAEIDASKRNKRSVWTVSTQPYSGAHFATFPPALIEPCILAGSRPGDTVLDPFFGSGTTGQVAQALGRQWIGCEINEDYKPLQDRRTAQTGMVLV